MCQKQHKVRFSGKVAPEPQAIPAIPRPDRACGSYPQNLWITLFMNLVHRAESRATTGVQGLFKKYRTKKLALKIK